MADLLENTFPIRESREKNVLVSAEVEIEYSQKEAECYVKLLRMILRVANTVPFRHQEICSIICRYLDQLCTDDKSTLPFNFLLVRTRWRCVPVRMNSRAFCLRCVTSTHVLLSAASLVPRVGTGPIRLTLVT